MTRSTTVPTTYRSGEIQTTSGCRDRCVAGDGDDGADGRETVTVFRRQPRREYCLPACNAFVCSGAAIRATANDWHSDWGDVAVCFSPFGCTQDRIASSCTCTSTTLPVLIDSARAGRVAEGRGGGEGARGRAQSPAAKEFSAFPPTPTRRLPLSCPRPLAPPPPPTLTPAILSTSCPWPAPRESARRFNYRNRSGGGLYNIIRRKTRINRIRTYAIPLKWYIFFFFSFFNFFFRRVFPRTDQKQIEICSKNRTQNKTS